MRSAHCCLVSGCCACTCRGMRFAKMHPTGDCILNFVDFCCPRVPPPFPYNLERSLKPLCWRSVPKSRALSHGATTTQQRHNNHCSSSRRGVQSLPLGGSDDEPAFSHFAIGWSRLRFERPQRHQPQSPIRNVVARLAHWAASVVERFVRLTPPYRI
jgi:hypothetical protein